MKIARHDVFRSTVLHRSVISVIAGVLAAGSLAPVALWPLGVVGLALCYSACDDGRWRRRAVPVAVFGITYFAIGLSFIAQFSLAGYLVVIVFEALFLVATISPAPPGPLRPYSFVGAVTLAEWLRGSWPFGGVPISDFALGQVGGPVAQLARIGGPLAVTAGTAALGVVLGEGFRRLRFVVMKDRTRSSLRRLFGSAMGLFVVTGACALSVAAPRGGGPLAIEQVAAVQGGGPRGLSQIEVSATVAFSRTYNESLQLSDRALVLWPENTVPLNLRLRAGSTGALVSSLARELHTTIVAGATAPVGTSLFLNEAVAWGPTGAVLGRVEKVHRVPFGEYVPFRSFFAHLANLSDIPRDATPGHETELLAISGRRYGVLISYETFFATDARAVTRAGGEALLVPTNTASYANAQVPAQELAASRLDAIADGRDVLQAATIGYSAIIGPGGSVVAKSALGPQAVVTGTLPLRRGKTIYNELGDLPILCASALTMVAGVTNGSRRRRRTGGPMSSD